MESGWAEFLSNLGRENAAAESEGWTELLSNMASENIADQDQASALSHDAETQAAQAKTKKRGRPVGTKGSKMYREEMRKRQDEHVDSSAPAHPDPVVELHQRMAVIRAAKAAKKQDTLESQRVVADTNLVEDTKYNQHTLSWIGHRVWHNGSQLQQQLLMSSLKMPESESFPPDDPNAESEQKRELTVKDLLQCERPAMSIQSATWATDDTRHSVASTTLRVGSAVIEGSGYLLGAVLNGFWEMCQKKAWKIQAFVCRRLYDETPTRIRTVKHRDDTKSKPTKILQSELTMSALIRTSSGAFFLWKACQPTWLQSMDRSTAENTKATQLDLMDVVPALHNIAGKAVFKIQMPVTDRYSSNLKAEQSIQQDLFDEYGTNYRLIHQLCKTHKLASVQKYTADLCERHVAGIIATAVSMQTGGSIYQLRKCLQSIISEKLQIKVGTPPGGVCAQHRQQVFDLYLKPQSMKHSTDVGAGLNRIRRRQRVLVEFYLNGDLEASEVEHWTTRDVSREQLLQEFWYYVVPALLPHRAPVFPRSRWVGADRCLDWCGLLLSCHNLFTPMMQQWTDLLAGKKNSESSEPRDASTTWETTSWLSLLLQNGDPNVAVAVAAAGQQESRPEGAANAAHGDVDEIDDNDDANAENLPDDDEIGDAAMKLDRAKFNETMRRKACHWGRLQGLPSAIAIFRHCITPVMSSMHRNLYIGSESWDTEQEVLAAQGKERSYKVFDEAVGNGIAEFRGLLDQRFHSVPPAVEARSMTRSMRALAFKLLARSGSAMRHLVEMTRKSFPTKIFEGIAKNNNAEVVDGTYEQACAFPCLLDDFSSQLLQTFPNPQSYNDPTCQATLLGIGSMWELDITLIEARHAAVRRLVKLRSVQTHAPRLDFLNADYACRQHARLHLRYNKGAGKGKELKKTHKKKVKKLSKKTGKPIQRAGGAWKAFLQYNMTGKFGKKSMSELSKRYHRLRQEEFAWFKEMGELATMVARAGFDPLTSSIRSQPSSAAVPPTVSLEKPILQVQKALQNSWNELRSIEKKRKAALDSALELWQATIRPEQDPHDEVLDALHAHMSLKEKPYVWCPGSIPTAQWLPPAATFAEARARQKGCVSVSL